MAARGTIGICGIRAAAAIQMPHAYRADHAVKRHVEIVHDRLQRLGLSVGANESKQCPRRNEHDDRKKSDRNDHFDQRKPSRTSWQLVAVSFQRTQEVSGFSRYLPARRSLGGGGAPDT